MILSTVNSNISFLSTLAAGDLAYNNKQSLTINAGTGTVTFAGTVGSMYTTNNVTYAFYASDPGANSKSIYQLEVNAGSILINGNITTFYSQLYNGPVLIGGDTDTRILLSEDPIITFNGTVDDSIANTHKLFVKAILLHGTGDALITFEKAVGSITPLQSLTVVTGRQETVDPTASYSNIGDNIFYGAIEVNGNITTVGKQEYTSSSYGISNKPIFTSNTLGESGIIFNKPSGSLLKDFTGGSGDPIIGKYVNNTNNSNESVSDKGDLERLAEKTISESKEEKNQPISGELSVVFCGAKEDISDILKEKCDE